MRKIALILGFFSASLLLAGLAHGQAVQIFGGYSYLRPSVVLGPGVETHPNLSGWEFSGTYNALKWIGATADFSGGYGTTDGLSIHAQNYLFGPQIHLPGPVSPFAHVLFGATHESLGSGPANASSTSFAVAFGAGIDVRMAPFLSLRPIQIDDLITRFGSSTQSQPRVSIGLVANF